MTEQEYLLLENRVRQLEEIVSIMVPSFGGSHETYHKLLDMDGYKGTLSQVLAHGNTALAAHQVNRACLRVGEDSAHCLDESGQTGPLGVARGVSGRFLSLVDTLPAGVATEVE